MKSFISFYRFVSLPLAHRRHRRQHHLWIRLGKVNDGLQGKFLDLGSVESVGSTMANLVLQMNQAVAK